MPVHVDHWSACSPNCAVRCPGWPNRVMFPVEVRVAAADDIWLSTAYRRETAYIAVDQYAGLPYRAYFDLFESVVAGVAGRPHWGKLHSLDAGRLASCTRGRRLPPGPARSIRTTGSAAPISAGSSAGGPIYYQTHDGCGGRRTASGGAPVPRLVASARGRGERSRPADHRCGGRLTMITAFFRPWRPRHRSPSRSRLGKEQAHGWQLTIRAAGGCPARAVPGRRSST